MISFRNLSQRRSQMFSLLFFALLVTLGEATTSAITSNLFTGNGIHDKVFSEDILFNLPAASVIDCASQCNSRHACWTFTFYQGQCQGHSEVMTSASVHLVAWGAKCFVRESAADQVRCRQPGTQLLTVPSLDLRVNVFCEDDWMVFLKRQDGSEDFYRGWQDYRTGFGDLSGEFWLGLEALHLITNTQTYDMTVDLGDWEGNFVNVTYTNFSVGPSADNYILYVDHVGGTVNDSLTTQAGYQFTTKDADHDIQAKKNCAEKLRGAWWYNKCSQSNLCGEYKNTSAAPDRTGMTWKGFHGLDYSLQFAQMKMRPA